MVRGYYGGPHVPHHQERPEDQLDLQPHAQAQGNAGLYLGRAEESWSPPHGESRAQVQGLQEGELEEEAAAAAQEVPLISVLFKPMFKQLLLAQLRRLCFGLCVWRELLRR